MSALQGVDRIIEVLEKLTESNPRINLKEILDTGSADKEETNG